MRELAEGRTLHCQLNGERRHDRCVVVCYLDCVDVAETKGAGIRQKYALPGYS